LILPYAPVKWRREWQQRIFAPKRRCVCAFPAKWIIPLKFDDPKQFTGYDICFRLVITAPTSCCTAISTAIHDYGRIYVETGYNRVIHRQALRLRESKRFNVCVENLSDLKLVSCCLGPKVWHEAVCNQRDSPIMVKRRHIASDRVQGGGQIA